MKQAVVLDNGTLVPATAAGVPLADRGFALGDAVFTTLAVQGGRPWQLARHLARLAADVRAVLGVAEDPASEALQREPSLLPALLKANGLDNGDAVLRITVSAGTAPRGLPRPADVAPHWWATVTPGPVRSQLSPGLRVVTVAAPWLDGLQALGLTQAKHASRLPWVLAREVASRAGADEALLCNAAGEAVSGTTHNLFLLDAATETLRTPPIQAGALPGVARAVLLDVARLLGFTVREEPITQAEVHSAGEVLLTNSVNWLSRVVQLDEDAHYGEQLSEAAMQLAAALAQRFD